MPLTCVGSTLHVWAIQGGRHSPNWAVQIPMEWVAICEALGRDRPLGLQAHHVGFASLMQFMHFPRGTVLGCNTLFRFESPRIPGRCGQDHTAPHGLMVAASLPSASTSCMPTSLPLGLQTIASLPHFIIHQYMVLCSVSSPEGRVWHQILPHGSDPLFLWLFQDFPVLLVRCHISPLRVSSQFSVLTLSLRTDTHSSSLLTEPPLTVG